VTALDAADLVVIAARTLGIGNDAVLASMDVPAAQAALSPRLSPAPRPLPVRRSATPVRRPTPRLARLLPEVPPRVGRAAAGALFAGAVGGVTVLAAACSHAPGTASARTDAVRQTQTRQQEPARPADLAYTACMRSHGVTRFPEPTPADVAAIAPATGIDPSSTRFRSVEQACRTAVPAAVIRIVTVPVR
jgi:hypothetical protein